MQCGVVVQVLFKLLVQVLFEVLVTVWAHFCKIEGKVLGGMQFRVLVQCCACLLVWWRCCSRYSAGC